MEPTISFRPPQTNASGMRDDIQRMLETMRKTVNQQNQGSVDAPVTTSFNSVLDQVRSSVDQVAQLDAASATAKESYITGTGNVDLTDVVLASQKSSVAYQGLLSIRNKFLEAYRQVMEMPV